MLEASVVLINRKNVASSVAFNVLVIFILCVYSFYFEGSAYARETKPIKLFLVDFIIIFVPIAITFALAWFIRRNTQNKIHITAVASALIITAVFPIFALYTSCYTGLDCI
jgi:hypothetical protein